MSGEGEHARERISKRGMAATCDGQRPGRVGAHELDQHALALCFGDHVGAEPLTLVADRLHGRAEPAIGEEEVEESRPRDLHPVERLRHARLQLTANPLRYLSWSGAKGRREQHRDVARVVAELRPRRALESRGRHVAPTVTQCGGGRDQGLAQPVDGP